MKDRYALLFGGTTYSNGNSTIQGDKDVYFWEQILQEHHAYSCENIYSIIGEDFTTENVVLAILNLAAKANECEQVTILFSTHGLFDKEAFGSQNILATYDDLISDRIILFLLKIFKPYVSITLIVDACESGTFLDTTTPDLTIDEIDLIKNCLKKVDVATKSKIEELINKSGEIPLAAEVYYITSADDYTNAIDSVFIKCCEIFYAKKSAGEIKKYKYNNFIPALKGLYKDQFFPVYYMNKCNKVDKFLYKYDNIASLVYVQTGLQVNSGIPLFKVLSGDMKKINFKTNVFIDSIEHANSLRKFDSIPEEDRLEFLGLIDDLKNLVKFNSYNFPRGSQYGHKSNLFDLRNIFEPLTN